MKSVLRKWAIAIAQVLAIAIAFFTLGVKVSQHHQCYPYAEDQSSLFCYAKLWTFGILRSIEDWIVANTAVIGAISTVAVAAFTFTLWRSTSDLWRASEKQIAVAIKGAEAAEKSAEAATKSAESFMNKDRARFIASDPETSLPNLDRIKPDELARWHPEALVSHHNIGASVGLMYEMRCDIIVQPEPPAKPVFEQGGKARGNGQIAFWPAEPKEGYKRQWKQPLGLEAATALIKGETKIFMIASITFRDVFGEMRTMVSTLKYRRFDFVPTVGDALNFEVKGYYTKDDGKE